MLQIEGLSIERGDQQKKFQITLPSLAVDLGEVVAITGFSGSGKSTLLEMIGLVLRPDQVNKFILGDEKTGEDIAEIYRHQAGQKTVQDLSRIRARHIGFVLQTGGLLPYLTVEENIQLPRKINRLPKQSILVQEVLKKLSLTELLKRKPHELSVGERQRVSFVRALAHEPMLLLADEPTAALDPPQAKKLFEILLDIVVSHKIAAVMVTHDWDLVSEFGIKNFQNDHESFLQGQGSVFHCEMG